MGSALGWILSSVEEKAWNAAKDGDISTLQDLCMSSITAMEWREAERGRTAFIMACSKGHVDCARWLVENGVDVYGRDYRGNTPLHYACLCGQPRVVELLLAQPQFSPFTLNAKGLSPLDAAREAYSDAADDRAVSTMADIAACIELLEERLAVHQDVIFTRTDNAVSRVVGIASLRSWTCSHAMVFRTSSSLFLELALYTPASPEVPLRCGPVPSSTYFVLIDPVNRPTTFVKQPHAPSSSMSSWLMASKAHAFSLLASPKTAASSVPTLDWVDFAAFDAAGLDAWAAFFVEIAVTKLSDPTLSHDHQFNTQVSAICVCFGSRSGGAIRTKTMWRHQLPFLRRHRLKKT
ncbi:hypothetical protein AaE_014375 [Aphanomyces astaci]|uniref:Uncharacterized protein n=1 Tax=Aphanomyces astaci TaxID=112090 RepID=A0A6A4Z0A3_APHAT|nr:hypothetical protein AaE_014375 [Aphanomyces astaci]